MLLALAFSAATLVVPSSPQVVQAADTTVQFREAVHRLATESPEVARQYERLASAPFQSRAHLFAVLPSSMKSDLWAHHLLGAVTTHAEFSVEQRSLIYDAVRLLSSQLFEASTSEGNSPATLEAIHALTLRAQQLFPREVARALFVELASPIPIAIDKVRGVTSNRESTCGSADGDQRVATRGGEIGAIRPIRVTPEAWKCSCSVADDWCGFGMECTSAGCQPVYSNCGTFLLFDCNGVCVSTS
jgi:hypothetical protein